MTIGQRIAEIRNSFFLSQEAFGEILGVTRQTVSKWETDQTLPELAKIALISRRFSVTTDSMLVDGISTFDTEENRFLYGVYRGKNEELAETERFSLFMKKDPKTDALEMALYVGHGDNKTLSALCGYIPSEKRTIYAYFTEENTLVTNDKDGLAKRLGEAYDGKRKHLLRKTERFAMAPAGAALPTVSEAGIARCLTSWRTGVRFSSNEAEMRFLLCTRETEYVFSIQPKEDNIYCGASYHKVFDLGLFGGIQFFRIRHYADDTLPFCTFFASFTQQAKNVKIPTNECVLGGCVQTKEGILWCVKHYHDDEIVLQGCGEDEYIYRRDECKSEALLFP